MPRKKDLIGYSKYGLINWDNMTGYTIKNGKLTLWTPNKKGRMTPSKKKIKFVRKK